VLEKRWEATVQPGFVGGMDPLVPGAGEKGADADLVDGPAIPLRSFRAVPAEGERIPDFFAALGVRAPENPVSLNELGGVTIDTTTRETEDLPPRALRAVDLYLALARATYRGVATEIDATGASGVTVDYAVTFDTSRLDQVGTRPRLMQAGIFPAVRTPTLAERLLGLYQDEGEDRLLVSTVFLLSPPNQLESEPDETWTPYVRHNLFWNLHHAPRNVPPAQPIRLFTGLLGGLGDLIGNQILSGINEYSDRVNNAVNTTSNEGRFWSI
jgi:hypothetical protein